jgi:anti-sigma B factor antagonist
MSARGPAFEVADKWVDRVLVVSPTGDIDALTAPQLGDAISRGLDGDPAAVIVDLSAVSFLASSGMTTLMAAHERISPTATFTIVADGAGTSRPLKLMGIDAVITIVPTLDEALAASAKA